MTKTAALLNFFSGLGLPAYPSNSVPKDATFPYLTFDPVVSNWYGQQMTFPTVNIWHRTESEAVINSIADRVSKAVGGGKTFRYDDGMAIVYFDGAWSPISEENDITLKRRYASFQIEFYGK